MELVFWKIVVRGRVQGVGFRFFVKKTANYFGISGWVKNNSDGTVSVEATGSEEQLASFARELSRGPMLARIDNIETIHREPAKTESSKQFEIK